MKKTIVLLSAIFLIACLTFSCINEGDSSILKTGDAIPAFTVDGPQGTFNSSEFKGKGGLLVFFASYCPTCHSALPSVQKVWEASAGGSLFAFAVLSREGVYDENEQEVARYWDEAGFTMPYYIDYGGEVYYRFARETIPRIYVIDKTQKITFMSVGNGDITPEQIARELEKALGVDLDV